MRILVSHNVALYTSKNRSIKPDTQPSITEYQKPHLCCEYLKFQTSFQIALSLYYYHLKINYPYWHIHAIRNTFYAMRLGSTQFCR